MGYRTERVFALTAVVVVGLALILAVSRGALGAGGTDSEIVLRVMSLALTLVASAGALWVARDAESKEDRLYLGKFWILPVPLEVLLPGLLALGFVLFLRLFEDGLAQVVVLGVAAVSFAAVYWGQAHGSHTKDRYFVLAQTLLNITAHVCAFLLFTAIYGLKVRSLYSATATGIVAFLLVYELLSRDTAWHKSMKKAVEGRRSTVALLSLVAGLIVGELTWGLNYWAALTTLIGGAFLLVVFYVTYGLLSHYVEHTLDRRMLVEFGVVASVGMLVVFGSAFLMVE